ncbi:Tns3 [Symbiodinium pilosum]|uniref:Tns3 protein n=1 Tax=Symbiodinium pilosum TaxID=2952 RepID=A0A812QH38_SYMPI|nr:Tns3 [Symbiodinium pilosum]
MEYPSVETIERLAKRLNESHGQKLLIFNFSEEPYERSKFDGEVLDVDLQKMETPPLKLLVELCLSASQWLTTESGNLLVVHCRSGYGRSALFGACFESFRGRRSPKEALQTIAERLPVQLLPSQQRYLGYFHQFLEGTTPQAKRLRLSKALLSGVPAFEAEGSAAFRPFIEVWVAGELAYSSFKGGKSDEAVWPSNYASSDSVVAFALPAQLLVSGDVLIQVFHLYLDAKRELAMKLAFHTNFINEGLQLSKFELDAACTDDRFTDDFFVDLVFEEVPKNEDSTEEEEKVQQAATEDAAVFEKARAVSKQLREEAAQSAPAEVQGGTEEGDVEAELEAMLMRGGPAEGSPKEMSNGGGHSGDEDLRKELAAAAEESERKVEKPVEKTVEKAAAPSQPSDKPSAKSAEIDTLFSEFDAVLAGGTKGDVPSKGGGYSESSKPAASTSKAAEKKDMFAEVDDFLKELDGGAGSSTK